MLSYILLNKTTIESNIPWPTKAVARLLRTSFRYTCAGRSRMGATRTGGSPLPSACDTPLPRGCARTARLLPLVVAGPLTRELRCLAANALERTPSAMESTSPHSTARNAGKLYATEIQTIFISQTSLNMNLLIQPCNTWLFRQLIKQHVCYESLPL